MRDATPLKNATPRKRKMRDITEQVVAALLQARRMGLVKSMPSKPSQLYRKPSKVDSQKPNCPGCGRPKSYGATRCRECYSSGTANNSLWVAL